MYGKPIITTLLILFFMLHASAQQILSLQDALQLGTTGYPSIKAKQQYAEAARKLVEHAKKEALPNLIASAQQDYGTVNGQNGPLYGLGGFGVASSGLPLPSQNWNAAFGALYLANINWEVFTFGKVKERIKTAQLNAGRDESDVQQELFQHQVKITAAYLNLLAAQRLTRSQQYNLARADTFRKVVNTRALNGLVPGVDSALANAEVSNAKSAWIRAYDTEQERAAQLAFLLGTNAAYFLLDTTFVTSVPQERTTENNGNGHPLLTFYQRRIEAGKGQRKYLSTLKWPTVSMFGILQTRGSGFYANYATNQSAYTHQYWEGIKPSRSNYLLGMGIVWNLTSIARINKQVEAQDFVVKGLEEENRLVLQQIQMQQTLAQTKMQNARADYAEAPIQLKAAQDAYLQKSVLYRNGLTTIVEVTQTLFALNRAEITRDIAYNNVWQALLLAAAAAGNMNVFLNEINH